MVFPCGFAWRPFGRGALPLTVADFTHADFPNPGNLPVWLPAAGGRARRIRFTATQPWLLGQGLYACALGELMVLRGHRNLSTSHRSVTVRTSNSRETPRPHQNLMNGQSVLGAPLGKRPPDSATIGHCWHSQLSRRADAVKWVQIDLGPLPPARRSASRPARLPQRLHHEGYGFPLRFRVEASDDPDFAQPHLLADHTATAFTNPGFSAVTIPAGLSASFAHPRVTATELQHRGDGQYHFALAELQAYAGDTNVALGARVSFLDNLEAGPNWRPVYLTDGAHWENRLGEWPAWLHGLSDRRERLAQLAALDTQLAALRLVLTRIVAWTLAGLAVAAALALLAAYYRLQLRRTREADALRRRIASDLPRRPRQQPRQHRAPQRNLPPDPRPGPARRSRRTPRPRPRPPARCAISPGSSVPDHHTRSNFSNVSAPPPAASLPGSSGR